MKVVVEIDNITEAQRIALEDLLATWVRLGSLGASRWTSFFADGDGNFRPKITMDGRAPQQTDLISTEKKWPNGGHGEYRIDFDAIAWKLRESESA